MDLVAPSPEQTGKKTPFLSKKMDKTEKKKVKFPKRDQTNSLNETSQIP